MTDLIWYDLFEDINTYFQANNLSDFRGYAHQPQTIDSTIEKYYYFSLATENDMDIFDIDGTHINDEVEPSVTFDITIGTKATDKTDTTRQSAELAIYNAQKAIRTELYNYRYLAGTELSKCLYTATINNIQEIPQEDGTQAVDISEMNITIFYNKTGA
jgi:hypothetical protein